MRGLVLDRPVEGRRVNGGTELDMAEMRREGVEPIENVGSVENGSATSLTLFNEEVEQSRSNEDVEIDGDLCSRRRAKDAPGAKLAIVSRAVTVLPSTAGLPSSDWNRRTDEPHRARGQTRAPSIPTQFGLDDALHQRPRACATRDRHRCRDGGMRVSVEKAGEQGARRETNRISRSLSRRSLCL